MHTPSHKLLDSKLPNVGTTIFTVMSAAARQHNALNLSQGFPDFEPDEALCAALAAACSRPVHQYAPMTGLPGLRGWIAEHHQACYGAAYNPETEITVTSGGTEALYAAIAALVRDGDEVICFDPAYDSYAPAVELQGGRTIRIPLRHPDYAFDWNAVEAALSPRTRLLLLNSPHNPTGRVLSADDLNALRDLARTNPFLILSDEVYEHMVFDGSAHLSLCDDPELASRSLVVGSFGKNLHITGWKVGWCAAPAELTAEFRKVHQYLTFSTATPLQQALQDYLTARGPRVFDGLPDFYQQKRDLFANLLKNSRFRRLPAQGTYFELYAYDEISSLPDTEFCMWMTREHGVAAIPVSYFYADHYDARVIRFCFAKTDDTLRQAAERLCQI